MRIGVVTASYPRSEGEHAGNFVAAHVAALRAAGHDVDVIGAHTIASSLFYGGGAPDELERGGLGTYLAAARFSTQLTREVLRRADGWDLVIAHWLAPSALAALAARKPTLAIAHGGDIHTLRRLRLLAPTLYALRARGVRLAFVSSELRDHAKRAAPRLARWLDEALVQPMGIDVARFTAIRAARATRPPGRHVVVVARLVPVKGVDVAIRAMLAVHPDTHMTIAGDGPERAALERLAAEAGMARDATGPARGPSSPHVRFIGSVDARDERPSNPHVRFISSVDARDERPSNPRVRFIGSVDARGLEALLRDADCVVIPSRVLANGRSEGAPMIASEALAAGVPVIASAVGGLRDFPDITRVRPDAPLALAAAIERQLASPHLPPLPDTLAWQTVAARLLDHVREYPICAVGDSAQRRSA